VTDNLHADQRPTEQFCDGEGPIGVNLRHERFVPTGPLNANLPPLQAHPLAAAMRHNPTFQTEEKMDSENWPLFDSERLSRSSSLTEREL
jgi:hypothetical protein